MIWRFRDQEFSLKQPRLMGVVNVTPDSFSDGGDWLDPERAAQKALILAEEGADILDLGAESTRPGAHEVSPSDELQRVLPVLKKIRSRIHIPISIDTTKPSVARACLEAGADIINDVSGLRDSGYQMAEVVKEFKAGIVLMHRRGDPKTMQSMTQYNDVVSDVMSELSECAETALSCGLLPEQIALDPGLGFAKNAEQNLEILRRMDSFSGLGYPLVVGPSRKSFIGAVTGRPVGEREFGTAAVVAFLAMKQDVILRVHNVANMKDVLQVVTKIRGENYVGA